MKQTVATATAIFAALTSAKRCHDLTIPVDLEARNGVFAVDVPESNIEVTNFILNLAQQGGNYSEEVIRGYKTVKGTYDIAATYCEPDLGRGNNLQILTHGIGFDRSYWDLPFKGGDYSYINEAVDRYGYSTFSWDRLGIAESGPLDPLNIVQTELEVDALRALTEGLRAGDFKGIPCPFKTVTHVGHSYGSQHTYALTAKYPDISDGITLEGFSQNPNFIPFFLYGGNFVQANKNSAFADLPNGYLAAGDVSAIQTNFFAPHQFDPEILEFAAMNGQPVTVGELLSFSGEIVPKNNFAGPVHIVTGERDVPYCGGDCYAAPEGFRNIPAQSRPNFPNAKDFKVTIIPNAGHGLNLEKTHPLTYASILNYFVSRGLGPVTL